ncbi:hypothetical protein EJ04DRAFT_551006 [Polyplosphaeria fusca]|uniref:Uncharacterized protein n=1 Tax=Polyplosphaeria fusca TaxID=682080 RepID=A0A9P4R4V7_9PLEO|nr:hypothetical protein EJ04DRAFT_551006 [Polyplosphaeria fusca]
MSSYQHLFSTTAVLNVFRNLRHNNTRDNNDLLLTFHYATDDVRAGRHAKANASVGVESTAVEAHESDRRRGINGGMGGGRSIGFVVPWRSMQSQKRELREKEKELAEALVVLAGEVAFTELSDGLQTSLSQNPLIQIRHLAAGLSRQLSKIELQMADNAPFAHGKNLYTGGEIARKFLPPIQTLFEQRPVPQRMIFELLMELKDLIYLGMASCDQEVLDWELENFRTFEDVDECVVRSLTAIVPDVPSETDLSKANTGRLLKPRKEHKPSKPWLVDQDEILYHLESLETTAAAMAHLSISDFAAKSIISLRRMLDRRVLNDFALKKKRRTGRCAEYARCMKWAGTSWRQGGACRRGCRNEDEDPEGLPCWHSSSRHFDKSGTYMVGNGREDEVVPRLEA